MDFVYVLLIAAVVLFGPWILLARLRGRLQREREENAERWADLTERVYDLEKSLKELQASRPRIAMPAREAEVAAPGPQTQIENPASSASVAPAPREQEAERVPAQRLIEAPLGGEALPEQRVALPFNVDDVSPQAPATREQA